MEPQNKVDKHAVAAVDNENNVIGHLPKGKSGECAKTMFYFLKTVPFNIFCFKVNGRAVSNKGMRIPCLLKFTGNFKMMNVLQELICKL